MLVAEERNVFLVNCYIEMEERQRVIFCGEKWWSTMDDNDVGLMRLWGGWWCMNQRWKMGDGVFK